MTVLLSVIYCTVSSVAAPPRHPTPSISNTSVNVPRWCARVWFRDTLDSLVRVLVQVRKRFNVRALLPLVRESEPLLARTKRDWEVRGATSRGL